MGGRGIVRGRAGQLLALLGLLLGLVGLVATNSARGDESGPAPLTVGGADWGFKESFRSYIKGPIAHGAIEVAGGASVNPDGTFHFPLASGTFEPGNKSTVARFAGSVHFTGHDGSLDMTVSRLAVEIGPEGAALFADIDSKSLNSGSMVEYPNVELATLDLDGVEPTVDSTTTSWTEIPAVLTGAGAPAFAGFYTAGTALDPFSFTYEGPGGKPVAETWTAPGTPGYAETAAAAGTGSAIAMYPDAANGVLQVIGLNDVRALDLHTLAQRGSLDAEQASLGVATAFDPVHGTIFAAGAAGEPVRSYTWDGTTNTYVAGTVPIVSTASMALAYAADTGTLYAVAKSNTVPAGSAPSTALSVARRDGSGWETLAYPAVATGGPGISGLVAVGGGKLIATEAAEYTGTPPAVTVIRNPVLELTDDGTQLVPRQIPDTVPAAASGTIHFGYANPVLGDAGEVLVSGTNFSTGAASVLTLTPGSGGYAAGTPLAVGTNLYSVRVDRSDGTIYIPKPQLNQAAVVKGGAIATTIKAVPAGYSAFAPTEAAALDGTFYFVNNVSPTRVIAYSHNSDSPTIATQPQDALVEVAPGAAKSVAFTAAAQGSPAPTVRWQERLAGSVTWTDVPGANGETLTVSADGASAGNRYRAVFANPAGEIATRGATLTVSVVAPPVVDTPPAGDGGGGTGGGAPASPPAATDGGSVPTAVPGRVAKPVLQVGGGALRVAGDGSVKLFVARCPGSSPCVLSTPKRVPVKVGGKRYLARVSAPTAVMAGRSATVKLRLPKGLREALAGHRAKVTLRVKISSDGGSVDRRVSATLVAPAAGRSA